MKERQRWKPEEDALLRSYVRQYGPREWNLVSQRMSVPFARDAKSCLERWKNYLKPGIKKGSLTEDEQRLVIRLQAKHGNKWKKIAAEVPGRTAKRLGKWWEVFKEKQHRELKDGSGPALAEPLDHVKYDHILESFAQKLLPPGGAAPAPAPEWRLPTPCPSVALTLAAAAPAGAAEVAELCSEMEEGRRGMAAQREEAAWRMRRVEMRLEAEKAGKRREKMEEVESRIRALREQQKHALEKMEAEYRDQLAGLRRDAEAKEAKLAEQWAARYARLTHFLHHMGYLSRPNNPSPSSSPGQ